MIKYIFPGILFSFLSIVTCTNAGNNKTGDVITQDSITTPKKIHHPDSVHLKKDFLYDQHTLSDVYPYKDTTREFQWEKIKKCLMLVDSIQQTPAKWGIAQNRRNIHGRPEPADDYQKNKRNNITDEYGTEQSQSIPLYASLTDEKPDRYELDGSLVKILGTEDDSLRVETFNFPGKWIVPEDYIHSIDAGDTVVFRKVIVVDRNNQNIATFEKENDIWLVRSMNPATTGLEHPPYQKATPLGLFVFQEKKEKMFYPVDGSDEVGGFAPYASRFSNGGYIHGVPVNSPRTQLIEYSETLGTTPRSHMCVRNATSHAKFIYDWGPVDKTLVFVIE